MTKAGLAKSVRTGCNIELKKAEEAVNATLRTMKNGIKEDGFLVIRDFGFFEIVTRENKGHWKNPRTGKISKKKRFNTVKWTRSKKLIT